MEKPKPVHPLLRTALPAVLGIALLGSLVFALVYWSASQANSVSIERQQRLVGLVVSQLRDRLAHDQESVTVWDDAVRNVPVSSGAEWIDANLGSWMHSYFGHDVAIVLNPRDEPIYMFADGRIVDAPSAFEALHASVSPLVKAVRAKMVAGEVGAAETQMLSPGASDITVVNGRPAIVSVKPIVSDTGDIEQQPGAEFVHVAMRYLDGSLLAGLEADYLFDDLRFSWSGEIEGNEAVFPLLSSDHRTIGSFVWHPYRPGTAILFTVFPVLAVGMLAVTISAVLLLARLRRRSIRLHTSEARFQHLAMHDPLTGLPNRTMSNQRLEEGLLSLAKGELLAVLYLDLDRFKRVNDSLGHPAGDALICEFAERLRHLTRAQDTISRIGGDEFTIVLKAASETHVTALCQRIIDSVRQPFDLLGSQVFVGVSIGVALAPADGTDRTELTRKADIALYHAKSSGRSRFAFFGKDMDAVLRLRREIESDLRIALSAGDQLQVYYQPLFSAANREVTGVEALVRWQHPRNGSISPEVFIPIAEESGLIEKVGEYVLKTACEAAQHWPIQTLAINVSAVELRNPAYASKVASLLLSLGMNPARIELEVTESALMDESAQCEQTVKALRALGVRIALDDFGTGFSSLSRLQRLAVDRIKIDRSFVRGFGTSNGDEAIVQAIVELARATGLKTTAEGVETHSQSQRLQEMGCDELQGFLLSRPISASEILSLLAEARRAQA
jgi:diguanylate cyclase (GGDEF)-like protein